jgi:hypothetical protein
MHLNMEKQAYIYIICEIKLKDKTYGLNILDAN